ncbi:cobalt transporter [Amycolatopsis sp. NPDC023774]|uniref:cobalt transporter n=1 Tax=Amycolatopsis sp. NPDC023774 TaxID=3155015 RepID=UPI003406AEE9
MAATVVSHVVEAVVVEDAATSARRWGSTGLGGGGGVYGGVAWQFAGVDRERSERAALKVIAVSFFALVADAVGALVRGAPGHWAVGTVPASRSPAATQAGARRRAGGELGSASAVAGSSQTLLCVCLSAVLPGRAAAHHAVRLVLGRSGRHTGHRGDGGAGGSQARRGEHCC